MDADCMYFVVKCVGFSCHVKYLTVLLMCFILSSIFSTLQWRAPFFLVLYKQWFWETELRVTGRFWLARRVLWASKKDMALNTEADVFFCIGLRWDSWLLGVEFSCWGRSPSLVWKYFQSLFFSLAFLSLPFCRGSESIPTSLCSFLGQWQRTQCSSELH